MELYNKYFGKVEGDHSSVIAFVDSPNPDIKKDIFWVDFSNGMKSGFFEDINSNLKKLFLTLQDKPHNIVKNIIKSVFYYTFIKIIEDEHNPDLEGEIMLFRYSREIYNIIQNHNNPKKKEFFLVKKITQGYLPTFKHSYFLSNKCFNYDSNLDINKHISFPFLNVSKLEKNLNRKTKLEYIQKQTNLRKEIISILEEDKDKETKTDKIINLIAEI